MRFSNLIDGSKGKFIIYGIGQAFNLVSPIVIAPYIIAKCGVEGFGKVGLGFSMALFLILIVDYAFDIKGTKTVSEKRNDTKKLEEYLSLVITTKLVLFLFTLIFALTVLFFIPFFDGEQQLYLCSLTIVFAQVFNPTWFLQGIENFKLASFLNIFSKTVYVSLVFCFLKNTEDYVYVNLFLGFSSLIFNVIGLLVIKHNYKLHFKTTPLATILSILRNDFTFCVSQLFLSIRQISPLFIISYLLGYTFAGQYKIIEQIISLFRTFLQVFLKYYYPSACYIILQNFVQGIKYWKSYVMKASLFVLAAVVIMFFGVDYILAFFNVSEANMIKIEGVFKISLVIPVLMVFSLSLEQLMFISNKNKEYIRITILVTLINLSLILLLIHRYELLGVILSIIISEIFFIFLYLKRTILKGH